MDNKNQAPGTRDHQPSLLPLPADQLTSSNSSSRSLLLVVVVAAADRGYGGDGHLYVAVVFVVVVKFYLVRT